MRHQGVFHYVTVRSLFQYNEFSTPQTAMENLDEEHLDAWTLTSSVILIIRDAIGRGSSLISLASSSDCSRAMQLSRRVSAQEVFAFLLYAVFRLVIPISASWISVI